MEDLLKLIVYPLYIIADFWVTLVNGNTWRKYAFYYFLILIFIIVTTIYLLFN